MPRRLARSLRLQQFMPVRLLLLAAALAQSVGHPSSAADPDGPTLGSGQDPDDLAPYLGLTLLDAEDLARDVAEDGWAPLGPRVGARARLDPRPSSTLDGTVGRPGPWWLAALPQLTLSISRREASQLTGVDGFGVRSATLFLVEASFGGGGSAGGGLGPPLPVRFRLAGPSSEVPAPPGEPAIAEVQAAAERAALVHLDDLGDWRGRARASAWLPELSVEYRRNVGEIDTLGIRSDLGIDSHNLQDVTRYGARASWQLSQLVFAREEVSAAQATLEIQRGRQDVVARVTELYFERQRLLLHPQGDGLRLQEVTAQLDALTGGFVTQRLRELGR